MKSYPVLQAVNHDGTLEKVVLQVENGKIYQVIKTDITDSSFHIAIPGHIDMHTHGYGGLGIMKCKNGKDFSRLSEMYLRNGTTSYTGSIMAAPLEEIERILSVGRRYITKRKNKVKEKEAALLGFHLEGPWLAAEKAGAQKKNVFIEFDDVSGKLIQNYHEIIKMITFDYHVLRNRDLPDILNGLNIIPACGHDASLDFEIEEAYRKGVRQISHIFCVTSSMKIFSNAEGFHKHLGTQETALYTDHVAVEVIADNHHITQPFWKLIRHCKRKDDIIIVSDSMPFAGILNTEMTQYTMGDLEVVLHNGAAYLPDFSALAGSAVCMHDEFRILVNEWDVSLEEAVGFCSYNPARQMGIDSVFGSLKPGMQADFLLLDKNLDILRIIKSGIEIEPDFVLTR